MANEQVKPKRDNRLDFIRGSAVVFMIICHALVFLYEGPSPVIEFFIYWGATVCFTMFLLVFGVLYGMKYAKGSFDSVKELRRALTFFIGYLGMGAWVYFWQQTNIGKSIQISELIDLVSTKMMSEYTEFVFAFVVFIMFAILLKPLFAKFRLMALWLIVFAVLGYVVAGALYALPTSGILLVTIKQHLIGSGDLHRFGLFMYLPIFALGVGWGFVQIKHPEIIDKLVLVISVMTLIILLIFKFTGLSVWHRWPPSIYFLLYGLVYPCLVFVIYDRLPKLTRPATDYVVGIGQNAFLYYVGHLVVLFPLQYLLNTPHSSVGWAIAMAVILFMVLGFVKQIFVRFGH